MLKDIENYIKEDIDLIKWNPIFVSENNEEIKKATPIAFEKTTGEDGFNKLFGKEKLIDALWNYAIKKEIMLKFPEGTYHEDFAVLPLIILKAKTMISLDKYEYYYVQTQNSIMRNANIKKMNKKLQDKLQHFDNLIKKSYELNIKKLTKQNLQIFATNSLLIIIPELDKENKKFLKQQLKNRKIYQYIRIRNIKQLLKKIMLVIEYYDTSSY